MTFTVSMTSHIPVIINTDSGIDQKEKKQVVHDAFKGSLHLIKIIEVKGDEIESMVQKLLRQGHEVIVAAGGDGTVGTVASQLIHSDVALGILPMGTMNNFVKSLQIPEDLSAAAKIILANHTHKIDAAEVNGKIFINNSSIGIYPRLVKQRERHQRKGHHKIVSYFKAFFSVFKRYPLFKISLLTNGKELVRTTPIVFIGNNKYTLARRFELATRDSIDQGFLSIFFTKKVTRLELLKLFFSTFLGTIYKEKKFDAFFTKHVTIESEHELLQVATDGEVQAMKTPLQYKILPKALTVIVP